MFSAVHASRATPTQKKTQTAVKFHESSSKEWICLRNFSHHLELCFSSHHFPDHEVDWFVGVWPKVLGEACATLMVVTTKDGIFHGHISFPEGVYTYYISIYIYICI